jgi:hypothetical protein
VDGVTSPTFWCTANDADTPRDIAARHGVDTFDVVFLNKRLYPELTPSSRLKGNTKLRIPKRPNNEGASPMSGVRQELPSFYHSLNNETPKGIASKLGLDAGDLVAANRHRYEAMTQTSRLKEGTKLRVPRTRQFGDSDASWVAGPNVVAYRHWTFPNDPVEHTYPSYMMAKRLNKRPHAGYTRAGEGSLLAKLSEHMPDKPASGKPAPGIDKITLLAVTLNSIEKEEPAVLKQAIVSAFTAVRESVDYSGARRADLFMKLPSKTDYPDYYDVIKQPMSLSEIAKRIESGQYVKADEFLGDMRLMFDNARTYNDPNSLIYTDATEMEAQCREALIAWTQERETGMKRVE